MFTDPLANVAVLNTCTVTASATDNSGSAVTIVRTGVPSGNIFPLGKTTITFTATDAASHTYFTSALTNPDGVVTIPSWPLAAGDYSLTAYFAEAVPLGNGKTLDARPRPSIRRAKLSHAR